MEILSYIQYQIKSNQVGVWMTNTFSWIFTILFHENIMPIHLDLLSWFQANQSLLFFSSCTVFFIEATNSNFIIFGLTRQEHKICRTRDEHAHNYMTDTEHNWPSIVDNIKPKVHRIVNIFLRLYNFIQNELIAMA